MIELALIFSGLISCGLAWKLWNLRARFALVDARCALAQAGEAHVTRALQLFAQELQALALGLRGHVDRLSHERNHNAASLAVVTSQLGHLADELAQHMGPGAASHQLNFTPIPVALLVAEAVAAMQAAIAPGRRHFRVAEASRTDLTVQADHRALRLILARVLGEAIRSSAQDDWVDISWEVLGSGLVLHVADEGAGTALPGFAEIAQDSRGIGLRLSLARSLVEAHGGTLNVEARMGVGTRVAIHLPAQLLTEISPSASRQTLGVLPRAAHILTG